MTAPTQLVTCPYCGDPMAGALAGCDKPACRKRELDADALLDRIEDQ